MAITLVDAADVEASIDANGNIDLTDAATSLLDWGIVNTEALKQPSIIIRELANHDVLLNNYREGAWSISKGLRDAIQAQL